jgi:hypothetical protein
MATRSDRFRYRLREMSATSRESQLFATVNGIALGKCLR